MDLEDSEFNDDDFYVIVVKNELEEDGNKSVEGSELEVITELNTTDSQVEFQHSDSEKEFQLPDSEEEFQLPDSEEEIETEVKNKKKSKLRIFNSYVEKLRQTHPELINDENKLIEKLFEAMKNTRPEKPPENFVKDLETLECSFCELRSRKLADAKRHYTNVHGPRNLVCFACGSDFRSPVILHQHEIKCKAPDIEVVLKARAMAVGRRGSNRPYLELAQLRPKPKKKRSKKRYYPKHTFDCAECPAKFKVKKTLIAHMNLHQGIRPYQCNVCAAAYTTIVCLRRHLKKHEPEKHERFICDTCERAFLFKDSLINHMKVHLPQKKYPCTVAGCKMRFSEKRSLTVHVNVKHRNLPKPVPCTLCIKRFTSVAHLKGHMKLKHGMDIMTRKMFFKSLPHMSDPNMIKANAAFYSNKQELVLAPDYEIKEVQIEKTKK